MGRTLFVGCSHTMGYRDDLSDNEPNVWRDNNYAEIYANINNKPVVVMASAGAGNRAFHRFIAYAFKQYDDIDEVFIIVDKEKFYEVEISYSDVGYVSSDRFKNFTSLNKCFHSFYKTLIYEMYFYHL